MSSAVSLLSADCLVGQILFRAAGHLENFPSCFYPAGSFGFLANSVVIPVLFTKKMNNTFSRFLVCLAIFDNVYVTCSILECVRKYFWGTELHKVRMCGRPTARTV